MKPPREKLPKFSLKSMTCSQLASWLETPPKGEERKAACVLRDRFGKWPTGIELLRKCGNRSAVQHLAHMKTARHLLHIPEISMMVGGGAPKVKSLPPFSASLKRMAEANGMPTVHRWGAGAYFLKRKEP